MLKRKSQIVILSAVGMLVFGIFTWVALVRANTAQFHMDEGLFLGAALRVLGDDFFLRHFWFDKPILTHFSIAFGILLGGENNLGFRLSGILSALVMLSAMFVFGIRLGKTTLDKLTILLLGAFFIFLPLTTRIVFSAFSDPVMMAAAVFCGFALIDFAKTQDLRFVNRIALMFTIAFLAKPTIVTWLPAVLGTYFLGIALGMKKSCVAASAKSPTILISVGVVYSLFNPQKLAPFTFYQLGSVGQKSFENSYWERMHLKFYSLFIDLGGIFGIAPILIVSIAIVFGINFKLLEKLKFDRAFFEKFRPSQTAQWSTNSEFVKPFSFLILFVLPFFLHAAFLIFVPMTVWDRYWDLLILHGIMLLIAALALFKHSLFCKSLVLAATVLGILHGVYLTSTASKPEKSGFRSLYQLRDELPPKSVVLLQDWGWNSMPFSSSHSTKNFNQRLLNALLSIPEAEGTYAQVNSDSLVKTMPRVHLGHDLNSILPHSQPIEIFQKIDLEERLRDKLRLNSKNEFIFTEPADQSFSEPRYFNLDVFRRILGKRTQILSFTLELTANKGRLSSQEFGPFVPGMGVRINRVTAGTEAFQIDVTDYAPLLWKGYFIPLWPALSQKPILEFREGQVLVFSATTP